MRYPRFHIPSGARNHLFTTALLLVATICLLLQGARPRPVANIPALNPHNLTGLDPLGAYGKLPITFEKNQGQSDPRVKFLAHGNGYRLFLTRNEAVLELSARKNPNRAKNSVVRLSMAGANPDPEVDGLDLQPGKNNYLIGNDPSRWHVHVPLYGRVRYRGIYPGIDEVYYGNQRQLETDFVAAPGSHPENIFLRVGGASKLTLDEYGNVAIANESGNLTLRRPVAYQQIDGTRREVAANFVLRGPDAIGITVGTYDSSKPLIIDPVIEYSTMISLSRC